MQLAETGNGRDGSLEDFPDLDYEVFAARQLILHKIHVRVQVFVVEFIDHFSADQGAEPFQIDDKTGVGIRPALDGHDKVKIVSMPIFVGAWPKNLHILLFCPIGVVEFMGSVKMFFAGDVEHFGESLGQRYTVMGFSQ